MIINLTASAARARAKRAGFEKAVTIRSGKPAARVEAEFVYRDQCSIRIAVQQRGVTEWLATLAKTHDQPSACPRF